jgi:hypothetical protein
MMLLELLRSPIPQIRRFTAHLAGFFIKQSKPLYAELMRLVRTDADWRVRCISFQELTFFYSDAGGDSPPTLRHIDRLRMRLGRSAWLFFARALDSQDYAA